MYRIEERSEAIRDVQNHLIKIYSDSTVFPSGVYDEATSDGVRRFQKERGLESSGTVDIATFEALHQAAQQKLRINSARNNFVMGISFPISLGDSSPEIARINELLSTLLEYYRIIHNVRGGTYFGKSSASAARSIRLLYGIKDGDTVDEEVYERMLTDLKGIMAM